MIIAQLSDPHIGVPGTLLYGRVDTADFLARAVGETPEYDHLRRILAPLPMPLFVIPGNHDAREPLRAAFGGARYLPPDGFIQYVIEDYPLRLVALDTHIPGENGGVLCAARLAWLDEALAMAPDRPTLLMMHHPPFLTGVEHMD